MKPFVYDDGGRAAAGYRGTANDCATRAIAIATERPYRTVYEELYAVMRASRSYVAGTSPRTGVPRPILRTYLNARGWQWVPTMRIGSGTQVHLAPDELPDDRLIVSVSRHLVAVIHRVIHDTHDPTRNGTRCVYGYFQPVR